MSDREALAAAVQRAQELIDDGVFEVGAHWHVLVAAARERLAQLPEPCNGCHGEGTIENYTCRVCGGSGKVYPAELVERIAKVLRDWNGYESKKAAVAVLDALNGETE